MLHDFFQILEIEQQPGFVEFRPGQGHPDLVIMSVRVLALAFVVAQVVSCGKRIFHGDFEHEPPGHPLHTSEKASKIQISIVTLVRRGGVSATCQSAK